MNPRSSSAHEGAAVDVRRLTPTAQRNVREDPFCNSGWQRIQPFRGARRPGDSRRHAVDCEPSGSQVQRSGTGEADDGGLGAGVLRPGGGTRTPDRDARHRDDAPVPGLVPSNSLSNHGQGPLPSTPANDYEVRRPLTGAPALPPAAPPCAPVSSTSPPAWPDPNADRCCTYSLTDPEPGPGPPGRRPRRRPPDPHPPATCHPGPRPETYQLEELAPTVGGHGKLPVGGHLVARWRS